jgi:lantibiotic transport system ATP-binding protein
LEYIIKTSGLNYSFGEFRALSKVTLEVKEGSIYGFVGPNGAGKTTTIRTLLGLYPVKEGSIFLFGKDIQKERVEILKNVGAMVEMPAHYEHLSARDNLEIARIIHKLDKKRVNEVLETVGLCKNADKKVSKFSMGMKQRLGIAWALLARPKILILDEPTNGLDPIGIKEIRELLGYLNRESNTTILISSHILSELERFITDVGIINKGSLVFQGSLAELYDASINNLVIETDEPSRLLEVLEKMKYNGVKEGECSVRLSVKNKEEIINLTKVMASAEIPFYGVRNEQKNLEEVFFDLMKN